jgi:toxin CcdB
MPRFDVYELEGRFAPLVVDVQADLLSGLGTRVVVPLTVPSETSDLPLRRLKPLIDIGGVAYLFQAPDIGAMLAKDLRNPIANVEARHRDDITRALDFLFQGF